MMYETREAQAQAERERIRLAAVAYLRGRPGSQVSIGTIAASIHSSPRAVGLVVSASPRTFRSRILHRRNDCHLVLVELHPHLVPA